MPEIGFAPPLPAYEAARIFVFCAVQPSARPARREIDAAQALGSPSTIPRTRALVCSTVPDDTKRILHNPCQSPPANGRRLRSSGHPARVACFGRDSVNGCRIRAKPRPSLQPTACATLREAPEMDTKSGTGCRSDACWKETVRIPSWRPDTRRRAGADLRRQAGCNLTIYVTACAAHQHDVING